MTDRPKLDFARAFEISQATKTMPLPIAVFFDLRPHGRDEWTLSGDVHRIAYIFDAPTEVTEVNLALAEYL